MNNDNAAARRTSYQSSFAKHGESPAALQWSSYKAAASRYRQLVADINITGKSILDAGCGMGDLLPYLYAQSYDFDYLGTDITPEFIEIARKRYQGASFEVLDPFAQQLTRPFDIVISSGVMNMKTPGWLDEREQMIARLFDHADETLVFNMAGWMQASSEGKVLGYANIPEIMEFCATLTPKLILRNHYNDRDFTIVMHKQ